jgi:hypothetical protein
MPNWNRTIDLKNERGRYDTGDLDFADYRDAVVEKIEKSGWLDDTPYPDTLRDHLGALKQAVSVEAYGIAFDQIYDVADDDRVWIETF